MCAHHGHVHIQEYIYIYIHSITCIIENTSIALQGFPKDIHCLAHVCSKLSVSALCCPLCIAYASTLVRKPKSIMDCNVAEHLQPDLDWRAAWNLYPSYTLHNGPHSEPTVPLLSWTVTLHNLRSVNQKPFGVPRGLFWGMSWCTVCSWPGLPTLGRHVILVINRHGPIPCLEQSGLVICNLLCRWLDPPCSFGRGHPIMEEISYGSNCCSFYVDQHVKPSSADSSMLNVFRFCLVGFWGM